MKKIVIGVLIAVFMFPAFSQAATMQELESQRIVLLKQIIVLLQARVQQLLALQPNTYPQVLGVATSTATTTSATTAPPIIKKRSGGGGGGGSSRSSQAPLTLNMMGTGNDFTITANRTLTPERFTLVLLNFPSNVDTPSTFTVRANTSNGGTADIILLKQATQSIYIGSPQSLSTGVTLTGQFSVIIPSEALARNLVYSMTYEGNGTLRTVNLENEGLALLEVLPGTSEPAQSMLLGTATTSSSIYIANIKNTGFVSADINDIQFTTFIAPAQSTNSLIASASLILANENSLTAFQTAPRHPGVIGSNTITFSNLPTQIAGQSTVYAFIVMDLIGTTTAIYPEDLVINLALPAAGIQAEHTNVTNDQEITATGTISASLSPYTLGLYVEPGFDSATTSDGLTAKFRIGLEVEALNSNVPMYFRYYNDRLNDISQAVTFHVEDENGDILDERQLHWTVESDESPASTINNQNDIEIEVFATPRNPGNYRLVIDSIEYTNNSDGETNLRQLLLSEEYVTDFVTLTPPDPRIESFELIEDSIEIETETTGANDETGYFTFAFDLKATGEDYYIAEKINKNAATITRGFAYDIEGIGSNTTQTTATISSTANQMADGTFHIAEGTTASFVVTINLKTSVAGNYRASLTEINYSDFSDTLSNAKSIVPDPITLLRSDYIAIQSSSITNPDQPVIEAPTATTTVPYEAYIELVESNNNPDSAYLIVDEDSNSDEFTILVADIEAEQTNILLNKIIVRIDTPGATTEDVIDEVNLVIDGDTIDGDLIADLVNTIDSAWYEFDTSSVGLLDENVKISIDISAQFEGQTGNYENFQTIRAVIEESETDVWVADAEGASTTDIIGTIVGEYHTLLSSGMIIDPDSVETTADTSGENDTIGQFQIEFEVTAFEEDFYISSLATMGAGNTSNGVAYEVTGPGGAIVSATLTSTADEDTNNIYSVRDGETENFTLTVTVDPTVTGTYRVTLSELNYTKNSNGITDTETLIPTPESDFRTSYQNVNAN